MAKLAHFIKGKAASHVEKLVPLEEASEESDDGCGPIEMLSGSCG